MVFADRDDAGRRLASRLGHLRGEPAVVLGLPRGGVPVAFQVARSLGAPLDVIVVRKLGVPQQPELAMGAVGEGGVRVVNRQVVRTAGVPEKVLAAVAERERAAVEDRAARYRARWPRQPLHGKVAVVVDDGIATGATARAACQVARAHGAARVVLAVPVAPRGWQAGIGGDADELVCVETPAVFFAIGQHYASFPQVADDEVLACLQRAAAAPQAEHAGGPRAAGNADPSARDERVEPIVGNVRLAGDLAVPENAPGIVVFAHGSGSSRRSPRNRHVARILNGAGLGTLLFDLLTPEEEREAALAVAVTGRRKDVKGDVRGTSFTLLGIGAMNSPRYAPAGLLIERGQGRVAIDGGPGAEPDGPVEAWLVTDERAELIRELRRLAAGRGLTPGVLAYRGDGLAITPYPVVHTSHPAYGYLIEAGGPGGLAPEFLEFPAWAAGADLMFAEAAGWARRREGQPRI